MLIFLCSLEREVGVGGLGRCCGTGSGGDRFACGEIDKERVNVEILVTLETCDGGSGAKGIGAGCW